MKQKPIYKEYDELEREHERLSESNISKSNKKIIIEYVHHLVSTADIGKERQAKLTWQLRRIAELLDKDFNKANTQDLKGVVAKFKTYQFQRKNTTKRSLSTETINDYKLLIIRLYKWLKGIDPEDRPPEIVKWIKKSKVKKEFGNLITWEDISKLSSVSNNPKDLALINFIFESGARIGEVLNMKVGDIEFHDKYCRVRLFGKTGERKIIVIVSSPYLAQYLNNRKAEPGNDWFWLSASNASRNERLRYSGVCMILRKLFKKANIDKRHNPHFMRHSRASIMAKKLTEPQLRLYFGWTKGSNTPSTYVHLSGRDIDNKILEMNGLHDQKEDKKDEPIECSICKTINKPTSKYCSHCGYGLSVEIMVDVDEKKNKLIEEALVYFKEIMQNPQSRKDFERFEENFMLKKKLDAKE